MANDKGFYRRRRGIYEHMEVGALGWLDVAIHDWLCGNARAIMNSGKCPAGVWIGSVTMMWDRAGRDPDVPLRKLQRHVLKLEKQGYFKRFAINKTTHAYVIDKLIVQDLTRTDYVVNAKETTDWRHPKYDVDVEVASNRRTDDVDVTFKRRTDDVQPCSINEKEEKEDTLETSETDETGGKPSLPVAVPKAPVQTKLKTVGDMPDSYFESEPDMSGWSSTKKQAWYTEKNRRAERVKFVLANSSVDQSDEENEGGYAGLDDIRDWHETKFGVSGERLRNCIIYHLDYSDREYFRKEPITPASMNRIKFVNLLNENTPIGWTPEKHRTYKRRPKVEVPSAPAEPSKYQPKEII